MCYLMVADGAMHVGVWGGGSVFRVRYLYFHLMCLFNLGHPLSATFHLATPTTFHRNVYAPMNLERLLSMLFKSKSNWNDGTWYMRVCVYKWHCMHSKNERFEIKSATPPPVAAAAVLAFNHCNSLCVCAFEFTKRKIKGFCFHSFNFQKLHSPL